MTVKTRSKFYYGHRITESNRNSPVDEGSGEINVTIPVGQYSLTDFVVAVQSALNEFLDNAYTVSVDRETRIITIAADATFDILFGTGTTIGQSANEILGFDAIDYTLDTTYDGINGSGSEYKPQFLLQDFIDYDDNVRSVQSVVNESASGQVEVVSYGRIGFMVCNITFVTDIRQTGCIETVIEDNPNGVSDLRAFLNAITLKGNLEFMPDRDNPDNFTKTLLESTPGSKKGTDYKLIELYSKNLTNYFETGKLTFRRVT